MKATTVKDIRFTTADLELLPENSDRYEVIDGELFVTRSPHWNHNKAASRLCNALDSWSLSAAGFGEAVTTPGVVFDQENAVEPDAVWIADKTRLPNILDSAGHLTQAPELVIESLDKRAKNARRDRELKLKLYSVRGVREYWIVDWRTSKLEVYRRENSRLVLVETLFPGDILTSPLLPNFQVAIEILFL
ncbi:MAG: Uma2 family endonuclease [Cyanobacteria bacterium P01_F01_bin.143]